MPRNISGTREWAEKTKNTNFGCIHECRYCFAHANNRRFKRDGNFVWREERVLPERLMQSVKHCDGRIMYPSTHDITPQHLDQSLFFIGRMLAEDNRLLIVSKPHVECIVAICGRFIATCDRIMFRFTIGSANDEVLIFWEPGAPQFAERLESLKYAFHSGYATSVSCEPMLDQRVDAVIEAVRPYVTDSIWLGKANRLKSNLSLNGHTSTEVIRRADELIAWQNDLAIMSLYGRYKDDPIIRWKESIKKVVGISLQTVAGLDI